MDGYIFPFPLLRFNQPFLIQSNNNASLSVRFRMDPQTGADQIIEGAFVYYDGRVNHFDYTLFYCPLYSLFLIIVSRV